MIPAITEDRMRTLSLEAFQKIMEAVCAHKELVVIGMIATDACAEMAQEIVRIEAETRKTVMWRARLIRHQVFGLDKPFHDMTPNQVTAYFDALDNEFGIKLDRNRGYHKTYREPWVLYEDIEALLEAKDDQ